MLRSSRDLDTRYTTGLIDESACRHAPTVRTRSARGSDGSSRESGAALGPAVLEHGTPGAGAHPGTEPVLLGTAVGVGLECTLHVVLLGYPAGCSAGSTRSCAARRERVRDLDLTRLRPGGRSRQPARKCRCGAVSEARAIVLGCDVHARSAVCPQLWTTVWTCVCGCLRRFEGE
jgi:hypothetical protein